MDDFITILKLHINIILMILSFNKWTNSSKQILKPSYYD